MSGEREPPALIIRLSRDTVGRCGPRSCHVLEKVISERAQMQKKVAVAIRVKLSPRTALARARLPYLEAAIISHILGCRLFSLFLN
jgi:hypothetical protein